MKFGPNKKRVIIIGIDALGLEYLKFFIEKAKLKALKQIYQKGIISPLLSTYPPISTTAWRSFLTGKNPGKHGVYEFTERKKESYEFIVSKVNKTKDDTFLEILSKVGKKVVAINMPAVYPPFKVNGILITGLLTPSTKSDFVYPSELKNKIHKWTGGYVIEPKDPQQCKSLDETLMSIEEVLNKRLKITDKLYSDYKWDVFCIIFTVTDRLFHFFSHYFYPKHPQYQVPNPYYEKILKIFKRIDNWILKVLNNLDNQTLLIILSDHGAQPLEMVFNINHFLIQKGYLVFKTKNKLKKYLKAERYFGIILNLFNKTKLGIYLRKKDFLKSKTIKKIINFPLLSFNDINWSKTKAFAWGSWGKIYINLKGREPEGIVKPGFEYNKLREEIIKNLSEIKMPFNNNYLIEKIYRKEEIFTGPFLNLAPDIYFTVREGIFPYASLYFPSDRFKLFSKKISNPYYLGIHTHQGALMLYSPQLRSIKFSKKPSVLDISPTIFSWFKIKIPDFIDGKPLI